MRFILVCFLSMVLLNAQNWNQPNPNHSNHHPNNNNYQSKPNTPSHHPVNNYQSKPNTPSHHPVNNYQPKPNTPSHQPAQPKPVVQPKPEPKKQSFWSWLFGKKEEPKPAPRKYRFQHKDWTNTFDLADLNHDGYVSPEEYRKFHEKHHHEKYYKTDEGADLLDFLVDVFKTVTGVGISRDEWNRRSPHYKH